MPALVLLALVVVGLLVYAGLKKSKMFRRIMEFILEDGTNFTNTSTEDVVSKHAKVQKEVRDMAEKKGAEAKKAKEDSKKLQKIGGK